MPTPSTFPPYGWVGRRQLTLLRVGQDGYVWVLEFGGVRSSQPVWTVFSADGTVRSRIMAEEELDVLYSNNEFAVVHHWDDLDVETIELRQISWQ
jgi:translation elongation factor P/translation initiation factor 5A